MDDLRQRRETDRQPPLARYDALTALPNRVLFHETLRKIIAQARYGQRMVSVLTLDIDHFQRVNDTLGRASGDELLRQFSLRLLQCLRVRDMIARLDGDEFGCILDTPEGSEDAGVVAGKLREALRRPFTLSGHRIVLTASIGISVYPVDSADADILIRKSDSAMHCSKTAGRDTYRFFAPGMNAHAMERAACENGLRQALDRGEFVLHYQPKMALSAERHMTGVEALIRWNRPGHGLVAPEEFIPILEQTGLIGEAGVWVIQAACRQIAEWKRLGAGEIPISINVSARQFTQGDPGHDVVQATHESGIDPRLIEFELQAERALRENGIDARLLELELTESSLMMHARRTIDAFARLKATGIRISIDDFGIGYSSLAYLKRLPVDVLKIDRSLIANVVTSRADAAIVTAIIGMAHSLDARVVAEGVESAEQLDFLRMRDCDEIQGYYLARPLSAGEISRAILAGDLSLVPAER
ncbi:bifunctional diguanylate cyclase/phosphodiesterase [Nitrosovibrio sp. Nv17]|uniref:putative bifunctional diguanylate cyclase/phosphodiesterase n=1 Tax=Nitrosovibrio sp. Nv17 TaxID=1855339 RepID=UPI000908A68D|nr:EAL domain-containing protein [Nitrosovibrio sp. Nv17]SFW35213.1 diguanylate cyclase (GGDEF) domain-containing protein [Nitrosovibrio sp. Nv17]